ncbi:MAG: DNA polymerase III delta subunit [Candidatus Saccharicenans subterraneus]|uniref:DNA polymerase III subunit delta n=1 Tax=Candidatus Saccharicenans subterraneus TaxID=2508984 RepID=A0A3E2BNM7_9BACT|nr:MAG: DNA polymerase III delta subunit [Candidatus Saccharicenans subterraneum]
MSTREPFYLLWKKEISPDNLGPGLFVYGEQAAYLRKQLQEAVEKARKSGEQIQLKTYFLFDKDWSEILEEAQSPDMFLFTTRKILVVYFPEPEEDDPQLAERAFRQLVVPFEKEIERYFASPPDGVYLVIVYPGKLKKGNRLLDFFSRLKTGAGGNLRLLEMKTPRPPELTAWVHEELRKRGKKTSPQAINRLLEAAGTDLLLLEQELEKLSLYSADRAVITEEDILAVCAFQKTYDRFALEDALESGSLQEALSITSRFLAEQPDASEVINYFTGLSRYILSLARAKVEVEEKKVPVKEVFSKMRPQLSEGWSLFDRKLEAFSACLKAFSQKELDELVRELGRIDIKLKSSDLDAGIMIETFLVRFFQLRDRKKREFNRP